MKESFNKWNEIAKFDLNTVSDYILTGKTPETYYSDWWLYDTIGDKNIEINILDFGCGIGRNTYELAKWSKLWNVVGYDNKDMIYHSNSYKKIKYNNYDFTNVEFSHDWDDIKSRKFDAIFCCIVLQHIYEDDLKSYIQDFKKMTNRLIVSGRRVNDDSKKNTWEILENCGLYPVRCNTTGVKEDIEYKRDGLPEEHFTCLYEL